MNKDEIQILFLLMDWTNMQQVFIEAAAKREISLVEIQDDYNQWGSVA